MESIKPLSHPGKSLRNRNQRTNIFAKVAIEYERGRTSTAVPARFSSSQRKTQPRVWLELHPQHSSKEVFLFGQRRNTPETKARWRPEQLLKRRKWLAPPRLNEYPPNQIRQIPKRFVLFGHEEP